MKFGVREICDVVLRAKSTMKVGSKTFYKNEPVLYFDTLTTSSLEGAATTVYAQGGRGNARLLAWEGERTLTFNMTDALISPESFAVLSGAEVFEAKETPDATKNEVKMIVHTTCRTVVEDNDKITIDGVALWNHSHNASEYYNPGADVFIMEVDGNNMSEPAIPFDEVDFDYTTKAGKTIITCKAFAKGKTVLVDYYVVKKSGKQIVISPDKFGGYFYLEASTLFRDEDTGMDLPAEFIIPRCKVQSNFTFTMAATGDPSTFDFVLDAFPDYTKFDTTKKVLAVLQVIEENEAAVDGLTERQHEPGLRTDQTSEEAFDHKTSYEYHDPNYPKAKAIDPYASANFNPGAKITLSAPTEDPVLGKAVSAFQHDLEISGEDVAVQPILVTEPWTQFSSIESEQTGYYMAFDGEVEGADKVIVTLKRNGTWGGKPATTLNSKDTFVFFLGATESVAETVQGIKVEGFKNNEKIGERVYILDVAIE